MVHPTLTEAPEMIMANPAPSTCKVLLTGIRGVGGACVKIGSAVSKTSQETARQSYSPNPTLQIKSHMTIPG